MQANAVISGDPFDDELPRRADSHDEISDNDKETAGNPAWKSIADAVESTEPEFENPSFEDAIAATTDDASEFVPPSDVAPTTATSIDPDEEPSDAKEIAEPEDFYPWDDDSEAGNSPAEKETPDEPDDPFAWDTHSDDPDDGSDAYLAPPISAEPEEIPEPVIEVIADPVPEPEPEQPPIVEKPEPVIADKSGLIAFDNPGDDAQKPIELDEVRKARNFDTPAKEESFSTAIQGARDSLRAEKPKPVAATPPPKPKKADKSTSDGDDIQALIRATQADVENDDVEIDETSRRRRNPDSYTASSNIESKPKSTRDILNSSDDKPSRKRSRGGSTTRRLGFLITMLVFAIGCVAYIFPDMVTKIIPAAQPALEQFTAMIDKLRLSLQNLMGR